MTERADVVLRWLKSEGHQVSCVERDTPTYQVTVPEGIEDLEAYGLELAQAMVRAALEGDGRYGIGRPTVLPAERTIEIRLVPLPEMRVEVRFPSSRFPFSRGDNDGVILPLQTKANGKWAPLLIVPTEHAEDKQHQAHLIDLAFGALEVIGLEAALQNMHKLWSEAPETIAVLRSGN